MKSLLRWLAAFLRWLAAGALRLLVGVVVFVVGSAAFYSVGWLVIELGQVVANIPWWLLPTAGLVVLIGWLGHLTLGLWSNDE